MQRIKIEGMESVAAASIKRQEPPMLFYASPPGSPDNRPRRIKSPMVSPCASPNTRPLKFSSFASLSSLSSLDESTILSSPMSTNESTGTRSARGSLSLRRNSSLLFKTEDYKPINIRVLNYHLASDTYVTRLTRDFFERMLWLEHEQQVLSSFRLGKADENINRRNSFSSILGQVLAWPKDTNTQTKTNPFDTLCYGHLPRNIIFQSKAYNITDDMCPGAFPPDATDGNPELLSHLRFHESGSINAVKIYDNLICYSEDRHPPFNTFKHYIQEAERLSMTIDRMDREVYKFICGNSNEIIFSDQANNLCKLDLTKLSRNKSAELSKNEQQSFKCIDSILDYVDIHNLYDIHAPISYYKAEEEAWLPVMVQAGDNGFHITGDADAEHMGVRSDMPAIVHKVFNAKKDNLDNFIVGLKILHARLTCASKDEFDMKLLRLTRALPPDSDLFATFGKIFLPSDSKHYKDYTVDPYYQDKFLPSVQITLARYTRNPKLLKTVGVSSLYNLIMQNCFDHPLYIHGTEDMHPGSKPEDFGAILICHKQKFVVTSNEQSYLAFLLHDRDILKDQRIGVHPYWLGNPENDVHFAASWLDVLAIQALHEGAKDICEFETYWQLVLEGIGTKRDSAAVARDKINDRFSKIKRFLSRCSEDPALRAQQIKTRIDNIYQHHQADINEILTTLLPPVRPDFIVLDI